MYKIYQTSHLKQPCVNHNFQNIHSIHVHNITVQNLNEALVYLHISFFYSTNTPLHPILDPSFTFF